MSAGKLLTETFTLGLRAQPLTAVSDPRTAALVARHQERQSARAVDPGRDLESPMTLGIIRHVAARGAVPNKAVTVTVASFAPHNFFAEEIENLGDAPNPLAG